MAETSDLESTTESPTVICFHHFFWSSTICLEQWLQPGTDIEIKGRHVLRRQFVGKHREGVGWDYRCVRTFAVYQRTQINPSRCIQVPASILGRKYLKATEASPDGPARRNYLRHKIKARSRSCTYAALQLETVSRTTVSYDLKSLHTHITESFVHAFISRSCISLSHPSQDLFIARVHAFVPYKRSTPSFPPFWKSESTMNHQRGGNEIRHQANQTPQQRLSSVRPYILAMRLLCLFVYLVSSDDSQSGILNLINWVHFLSDLVSLYEISMYLAGLTLYFGDLHTLGNHEPTFIVTVGVHFVVALFSS